MGNGLMTEEELKAFIVKELPRIIAEHPEIKYEILGLVTESFVKKDDFKAVLDEIRLLREDFNRRFEEHSRRLEEHSRRLDEHSRRIEELTQAIVGLREDFNKGFEEHSRRIEEHSRRIEELSSAFWALKKSVDTIGSRWGIFVEDVFRNSMMLLLDKHFGARVEEITVGEYQVDLVITNGAHILIELSSSTKEKDVENLLKVANAYREEKGVEPQLYIVTAYISPRLYDFAKEKGISILSHDSL